MAMKVGMMQPYLFPYLGYFQLISAVDVFVLGDNLKYVKESWINRNRILLQGQPKLISFPLKKGSCSDRINERELCDGFVDEAAKMMRVLHAAYAKAPLYKKILPLIEEMIFYPETNLAKYTEHSIRKLCSYLEIKTPIVIASDLNITDIVDKQDRVIKTTKLLGGEVYINFIGGRELYDFDLFKKNGLILKFHKIDDIVYPQLGADFVPLLSIIDVLMFNEVAEVQKKLDSFSLIGQAECALCAD